MRQSQLLLHLHPPDETGRLHLVHLLPGVGDGVGTGEGRGEGTGEGTGEGRGEGTGEGTGEGRGEGTGVVPPLVMVMSAQLLKTSGIADIALPEAPQIGMFPIPVILLKRLW